MKSTDIRVAILGVSLFFVPALLAQSPASGNQSAASPAPTASAAEVPRLIKFSGTLLDAQDQPLAGPVGVTFALHSQQSGGAALWMETQNVEPDARGVYTILLGANSAKGVPAELFASGEARWLEVQVERQAAQPRILLVSVPYALKAGDAQTLGGKPASAYLTTETLASAGTSAAAATATPASSTPGVLPKSSTATTPKKAGSTPQPAAACPNVTSDGTATVNSIAKFTAACNIQNSAITETGGKVGIGTTTPTAALHVNGNTLLVTSATTAQVQFSGSASTARFGQDANGAFFASDSPGKAVRFYTNNGALNEGMRITSAGNVGIGTATPAQKLSVAGTIQSTAGGVMFPDATVQSSAAITQSAGDARYALLGATSNTFKGSIAASSFSGSGAGLTNVNAALLNGLASTAFASVGANSFTGNQSVTGNVSLTGSFSLPDTTDATTGVINMGGAPFAHNFGVPSALNTFLGANVGNFTMTGTLNTASGAFALQGNTAGNLNTASGVSALQSNTTGGGNTASGVNALFGNATGGENTASGVSALTNNTGGDNNTASGVTALFSNTTGSNNTALGFGAGLTSTSANANTTGSNNTFIGFNAGPGTSTQLTNATAIGANALVSVSNALVLGGTGANVVFVGIGTATPGHTLEVAAGGTTLADAWAVRSSRRWKSNIQPLAGALEKVQRLRGVSYDQISDGKHQIGVIAEEVGQVLPEIVTYEKNGVDAQGVDYARLTALLIEAAKEQQREIQRLTREIRELRKSQQAMAQLKARSRRPGTQQKRVRSETPEAKAVHASNGSAATQGR